MRLPVIPFVVAAALLSAGWYLFHSMRSGERTLGAPRLSRLASVGSVETEAAVAPDGARIAVIASGDLWLLKTAAAAGQQLTRTAEAEYFPNWTPDGKRILFTRGTDAYAIAPEGGAEALLLSNAAWLSWSQSNRIAFVRDRALWLSAPDGSDAKKVVDADSVHDVEIQAPRFSPDSQQIAFIKTQLGIRGEVWTLDVSTGMARPVVADRTGENPLDSGWINGGQDLAYLTNRSGSYSIWYVDFAQATINPLTQPLVTMPLGRIGMSVWKDRIVVPRHFVDSNIVVSDGGTVAASEKIEFQPAVSPDEKLVAYTVADENKSEIWTAGIHGENPKFRTLGKSPRFSPNGFQIVYAHRDLTGNDDVWTLDIRDGSAQRITDAEEIDVTPDWSPNGQSIAFSSARGGAVSVWTAPAAGGKRLRINDGGYAPRYSPDGRSILFWNMDAFWTISANGENLRKAADDGSAPSPGVWSKSKQGPPFFTRLPIDRPAWPQFDVMKDGRFIFAPIDIRETGLWAVDLTYREGPAR